MSGPHIPRLSIGLPVYNGEQFLRSAIESLLAQTFTDFELIISDNCSTDSTPAICQEFAARDARVHYHVNDTNIGAAGNFNSVVGRAQGYYFVWANHDDLWKPTCFERCVEALDNDGDAVVAFGRSEVIDEAGRVVTGAVANLQLDADKPELRVKRYIDLQDCLQDHDPSQPRPHQSITGLWTLAFGVMRKHVLLKTPLIGPYVASDTVLIEELLMHGRFVEIDEVLFFKRDHAKNSTRAHNQERDRTTWFTGRQAGGILMPKFRVLVERLKAAFRAPAAWRAKLACAYVILSRYLMRRGAFKAALVEMANNAKRITGFRSSPR